MSGVESFIPGMDGVTGVTEKYVTGLTPGEQLGVSMTSANNTYLQPTGFQFISLLTTAII